MLLATQVALSMAILPAAMEVLWGTLRPTILGPGLPVEEFVTASLVMEGDSSRFDTLRAEAAGQLASKAGIAGVTTSAAALYDEPGAVVELEGTAARGGAAVFNSVDGKFFEVFDVRVLAGRSFDAGDFVPGGTPVIVNQSFAAELLGSNALGQRLRYRAIDRAPSGSLWHEIVGVVEDLPRGNDDPTVFHPLRTASDSVSLTIHAPAGIGPAVGQLRDVVGALDAQLRIGDLRTLDEEYWQQRSFDHMFGSMLGSVLLIVLLFSMAGIYALMAFIVAQRWREIGVRTALGAQPRRLLIGIFGRAAVPLLIGAMAGCALALLVHASLPIAEVGGRSIPGIVPASAALMIAVGLLAVAGPARRAIHIDPTEALRIG